MPNPRVLALLRTVFRLLRPFRSLSGRLAGQLFVTPGPRRATSPRAQAILDRAEDVGFGYQGRHVRGFRWPGAGPGRRPVVLLAHGWGSHAARFTRWVGPLREAGFTVVAFDGPAHGGSAGRQLSMPGYVAMLREAVEHVGPIDAVVGHSFGGAAATYLASGHHLSGLPPVTIGRLVLIAAPDRAADVLDRFGALLHLTSSQVAATKAFLHRMLGFGSSVDDWSSATMLADHPVPTLIIHDREDEEVPFSDAEAFAAAPRTVLLPTIGHGHHRIVGDDETIRAGLAFLGQTLATVDHGARQRIA